jgi:hypothetical protein
MATIEREVGPEVVDYRALKQQYQILTVNLAAFVTFTSHDGSMKCTDRQRGPVVDRSGVYHYRRRVPEDIRFWLRQIERANPSIGAQDKREEKKSLGRDKATAGRLWKQHNEKVEARWAELRSGRKPDLTIVEREALAGDIYRLWLSRLPETIQAAA